MFHIKFPIVKCKKIASFKSKMAVKKKLFVLCLCLLMLQWMPEIRANDMDQQKRCLKDQLGLDCQLARQPCSEFKLYEQVCESTDYEGNYCDRTLHDYSWAPEPNSCNFITEVNCNSRIMTEKNLTTMNTCLNPSHIYVISIKNKNFNLIPAFSFANLTILSLNLYNNQINRLHSFAFNRIKGLKYLRLTGNRLSTFTISEQPDLEVLYLNRNRFRSTGLNMFKNLPNLKVLHLSFNQITQLGHQFLSRNKELRTLELSSNRIGGSAANLNSFDLPKLINLNLNENFMHRIKSFTFERFPLLRILKINRNDVSVLEINAFANMPSIQRIRLNTNKIVSFQPQVFATNLSSLRYLSLSRNRIRSLSSGFFNGLPNMRDLRFYFNKISRIQPFTFSNLNLTVTLDLSNMLLRTLTNSSIFYGLNSLKTLNLNNNSLKKLENEPFKELKRLEYLSFYSNLLDYLHPSHFEGLGNLRQLNLDFNYLVKLENLTFSKLASLRNLSIELNQIAKIDTQAFSGLERTLEFLSLNRNRLSFIKHFYFLNLGALRELYLVRNQISSIQVGSFSTLVNLNILDLSENSIFSISPDLFEPMVNLRKLILTSNVIVSLKKETFKFMRNLTELYLNKNLVNQLTPNLFFHLSRLNRLSLDNNLIVELDFDCFNNLNELVYLNLNNNNNKQMKVSLNRTSQYLPSLKSLYLNRSAFSLIKAFNLSNLNSVDFSFSELDQETIENIQLKNVESFFFQGVKFKHSFGLFSRFGPSLKKIDLSGNSFRGGSFLQESPNLERLVLSNVNLSDLNLYENLDLGAFQNLVHLDLSFNRISQVPVNKTVFHSKLNYLSVSNNLFRSFQSGLFSYENSLLFLDLSFNSIELIDEGAFENLIWLEVLDLSHNRLKFLDEAVFGENCISEMRILYLDNQKSDSNLSILNICVVATIFDVINLSGNMYKDMPENITSVVLRIDDFDMSNNKLTAVKTKYFEAISIIFVLDLSRNMISQFERKCFFTMNPLLTLNLSWNRIGRLEPATFTGLINLEVLDLSHNFIESLVGSVFQEMIYLNTFDVSFNLIVRIEDVFRFNVYVKFLAIHENPIVSLFRNYSKMVSLKFMYISPLVQLSYGVCLIINEKMKKDVVSVSKWSYYDSTSLVVVPSETEIYLRTPYARIECFYITFLIRRNIKLNMHDDLYVDKFIHDCTEWSTDLNTKIHKGELGGQHFA